MENSHNFERIVGTKTEKEHEDVNNILEEAGSKDFPGVVMECSAEITIEHQMVVQGVVAYTKQLVESLGVDKPIPKIKFALLDKQKPAAANMLLGKNTPAAFFPKEAAIIINEPDDLVDFTETFAHEYFHALGYSSAQVKDGSKVGLYRNGMSMYDRDDDSIRYFGDLEEAIVTELSMKVLQAAPDSSIGSPTVQSELKNMNTFRDWFNHSNEIRQHLGKDYEKACKRVNDLTSISNTEQLISIIQDESFTDLEKGAYIDGLVQKNNLQSKSLPYSAERKDLWILIDKIADNETDLSRDQVFDEFAKAHFSGNYLPIARLVEKAYGKGSFRKLAYATKRTT